jgi:hypothetical protein
MKLRYRGQELGLKTGEPLDFQIDKQGYVSISVSGKHIGFLVLNEKAQPIFSSTNKTCFYLQPKQQVTLDTTINTTATNQDNILKPKLGSTPELESGTKPASELELDNMWLLVYPIPWYKKWSFWYKILPILLLIIFLVLCVVVWKVGYKHGQQWFIYTVDNQYTTNKNSYNN